VKDLSKALQTAHHLLLSHGMALPVIRRNSPDTEVGITLNLNWSAAASNSVMDRRAAREEDGRWFRWFADPVFGNGYPSDMVEYFTREGGLPNGLDFVKSGDMDVIAGSMDFIGLNYYCRNLYRATTFDNDPQIDFPKPKTPENWTEMGWENYPEGLTGVLGRVYFQYKPRKIYITENGASYSTPPDENRNIKDENRTDYLRTHLAAAHRAIQAGVPLSGYFAWSLLDNFEWAWGYSQRFGIVWVDYETQKRIPKDSAKWYKNVIRKNGF